MGAGSVVRWLLWSPAIAVILSATAMTGGLVLFLLPLLGVFYAMFCLVAWQGSAALAAASRSNRPGS